MLGIERWHAGVAVALLGFACVAEPSFAADKTKAAPVALSEDGQKLQAKYAEMLKALQTEIASALPALDAQAKANFMKAREATISASKVAAAKKKALEANQAHNGLLNHRKGWVSKAEKNIAQAEKTLKAAKTDQERKAAQDELAKWQADKAAGLAELKKSQEAVDKAKIDEPRLTKENQEAQSALEKARAEELAAANVLLTAAEPFIASDKWDAALIKGSVLAEATPKGLAEFAQQSKEHEALIDNLLSNNALMKQMLVAGGAKDGQYGKAIEIYTKIQKASPKASEGLLQRLALATSLEHAIPVAQRNADAVKDGPATVDPVGRYLHYEKAYLNGELDPAFKTLSTWEYRMVVDCGTPDHVLEWGRTMLRNYRPDHVQNPQYGWRYSGVVRTDVTYKSSSLYKDTDTLEFFQNIIKNGGICGRRAFFGRFIVQSFGLPVWGVTQHKHAALGRWTPEGWVVNLGANWQFSWFEGRSGPDFILETQARKYADSYPQVQRAEWLSAILAEPKYLSMKDGSGGLWNNLAVFKKKALVASGKPAELAALGQELGEANESDEQKSTAQVKAEVSESDKKIVTDANGTIVIPAAACKGAQIMPSYLGGHQLFCGGNTFTCDVDVPAAGKYNLTARIVTVQDEIRVKVAAGKTAPPAELVIPYTCGNWQLTAPAELTLSAGKNTLTFEKPAGKFSLRDLTLTPVK